MNEEKLYSIELAGLDMLLTLDALAARAEAYEETAEILDGRVDNELFLLEDVSDADDAKSVAMQLRDVIRSIDLQIELNRRN